MTIKPAQTAGLILGGMFSFRAEPKDRPEIIDEYRLRIQVPPAFPKEVPIVVELDGKIPRTKDFHVNYDATLCLGSPLRLVWNLSRRPSIGGFAAVCLVPYLYAISHKLKFGGPLPFDELPHGSSGVLADYADLFGLGSPEQAERVLRLLAMEKRIASKQPCPCGCRKRLGKCSFNRTIKAFRSIATPTLLRELLTGQGNQPSRSILVSRPRVRQPREIDGVVVGTDDSDRS